MKKLEQIKEAIANTPPDRLAKIEYQSHFMQMLGISVVCIFLIVKGFWFIIFAFIFGLGISYSQGITAYKKYINITAMLGKENPKGFEAEISPTRRRSKIINHVFGGSPKWQSSIIAVALPSIFLIPLNISKWLTVLAYLIAIPLTYVLIYFFLFYWVAYPTYKKEVLMKK